MINLPVIASNIKIRKMTLSIRKTTLIPTLVMLPNLVWILLPKKPFHRPGCEPLHLTILENVGRV